MLTYAIRLIGKGPLALATIGGEYPRCVHPVFQRVCRGFARWASVAMLLNWHRLLATCAIIVWLGSRTRARLPLLVALSAMAFGPGNDSLVAAGLEGHVSVVRHRRADRRVLSLAAVLA